MRPARLCQRAIHLIRGRCSSLRRARRRDLHAADPGRHDARRVKAWGKRAGGGGDVEQWRAGGWGGKQLLGVIVFSWLWESARGVRVFTTRSYLHKNNFVHRDIKPENFLMQNNEPNAEIKAVFFLSPRAEKWAEWNIGWFQLYRGSFQSWSTFTRGGLRFPRR